MTACHQGAVGIHVVDSFPHNFLIFANDSVIPLRTYEISVFHKNNDTNSSYFIINSTSSHFDF